MLAIGNLVNQGTVHGEAHGVSLDSLLQMIHIKGSFLSIFRSHKNRIFHISTLILGVDKRTTILDYVVKGLYDKGEESILSIVNDLYLLDNFAKLSAKEALKEVNSINASLSEMERQCNRVRNLLNTTDSGELQSSTASTSIFNFSFKEASEQDEYGGQVSISGLPHVCPKSTSKVLMSQFSMNLESNLIVFRDVSAQLNRSADILRSKWNEIIEYFGEDPNNCDTVQLFGRLLQFKMALATSKEAAELRRSHGGNLMNISNGNHDGNAGDTG